MSEARPRIRESYIAPNDTAPFDDWLRELKDLRGKGQIESRLRRVDRGLMGVCEPVTDGIIELKIDFGPGYRVYFVDDGTTFWSSAEAQNELSGRISPKPNTIGTTTEARTSLQCEKNHVHTR